ncbi:MAG: hypothetical protein ACI93N_001981 [Flavobacteriaceae bacterium]|jgi:hypothetical protein
MTKTLLQILISILLLSCNETSQTEQSENEQEIYHFQNSSKKDLKEDLIVLFNKLDSTHYNLYHKYSKIEFENKRNELLAGIKDSMNLFEFYYHTLPLYDMLEDAHSLLIFPFKYTKEYEKQGGKFIPLEVIIKDNEVYISNNHSQQVIPLYSKLISVNDISSTDIIEKLDLLVKNERKQTEDNYMSLFFDRILYPIYGFDKHYEVLIKTPDGESKVISIDGVTADAFNKEKEPYYSFHTIGDSIGFIDINLCEGRYKFASFCDSVFVILKQRNIPNLIIDVRDNGGGSTFHGDTLFTYITNKKFTQYGQVKMKMSPMVNNNLDTIYFEEYNQRPERTYDNPKRFEGDVYMIANQNSFSSATMLAATFKCYDMGTLIGEETGGVEVFFDEPILMTLPNTGNRFLASYQYRWCACGQNTDRGIIPDYETTWNVNDKIEGVDTDLKLIQELINNKQVTTKHKLH